jgi:oxygen-independent coproporphyrinogen-3 oxidase
MIECGVNRLSFGVQTFIDREAAVSGRLHTREMALRDIARARELGISSINVDLIAGLAHQTPASWQESLDVLLEAEVPHASVYMLEVDEDSRLGRELIIHGSRYHAGAVPEDDVIAELYSAAIDRLSAAGIMQYEISNFARHGAQSRHNRKYWERKPYVGFGVDASSMLRTSEADILRFSTTDDLECYLKGFTEPEGQRLGPEQQLEEAWFLGLRLMEGVSSERLVLEFGEEAVQTTLAVAEKLCAEGLLQDLTGRWSLTGRGKLLSNEVFERFLGPTEEDSLPKIPALIS